MGKRRSNGRSTPKTGRALLLVMAVLAALLPAVLVSSSAGAQASPCRGGPGDCTLPKYVLTREFTGTGACEWTHRIDWGDGNIETVVRTQVGEGSIKIRHRYAQPGTYVVRVTGSGRPANANTRNCDLTPSTTVVEMVPAGTHLCLGWIATWVGTSGPDTFTGTPGTDIVVSLGGNDTIDGGGGSDRICAGPGKDTVSGGAGVDGIKGGKGNDTLRGGGGVDVVLGGPGNDRIFGGGKGDLLAGGSGDDLVDGGKGNDVLDGNKGNDTLRGRAGNDTMDGGAGRDVCRGHGGRDTRRSC